MTKVEMDILAHQLACPTGEDGRMIADKMYESNAGMIHNALMDSNIKDGDHLLELGHGNGQHIGYVFTRGLDIKYQGLEISDVMFKEAQKINASKIVAGKAHFSLFDGYRLPYEEAIYDKVLSVNTIYFWKNPALMCSEFQRVLKPNGYALISYAQKSFMSNLPFTKNGFRLYDTAKVTRLFAKSGLKLVRTKHYSDRVKSKSGEWVDRVYTNILFKKNLYKKKCAF